MTKKNAYREKGFLDFSPLSVPSPLTPRVSQNTPGCYRTSYGPNIRIFPLTCKISQWFCAHFCSNIYKVGSLEHLEPIKGDEPSKGLRLKHLQNFI